MEKEITRIGMDIPGDLIGRCDDLIFERGYSSRSEGVRDAIRNYINYYEWLAEVEGELIGTLTLIYDPKITGVADSITNILQEYMDIIKSSIRIPLDSGNHLEVIILRGDGEDVKALTGRIMSLRGVKHVKLNITSLKLLNLKISLTQKNKL
jgi:CopG family nickel-responsive transcriptional regulator